MKLQSKLKSTLLELLTDLLSLLRKSPYSVRIRENTEQKKRRIWTFFNSSGYFQSKFLPDTIAR